MTDQERTDRTTREKVAEILAAYERGERITLSEGWIVRLCSYIERTAK